MSILVSIIFFVLMVLMVLVMIYENSEGDKDKSTEDRLESIYSRLDTIRMFSKSEDEVTLVKGILSDIQELLQYRKNFPEESEVAFYKYNETVKVLETAVKQIEDVKVKDTTLKEMQKTIGLMKEDMVGDGVDKKIAKAVEDELKILQELRSKSKGRNIGNEKE